MIIKIWVASFHFHHWWWQKRLGMSSWRIFALANINCNFSLRHPLQSAFQGAHYYKDWLSSRCESEKWGSWKKKIKSREHWGPDKTLINNSLKGPWRKKSRPGRSSLNLANIFSHLSSFGKCQNDLFLWRQAKKLFVGPLPRHDRSDPWEKSL